MPRPFPLRTLLEHSRHRLEAAERAMRYQKRKEEAALARLDELRGFRAEYQQRLAGAGQMGMDIHMLRDYHVFLKKLDVAIGAQEDEVKRARERWEVAHGHWSGARAKVKAYETLERRHFTAETRLEDKLDQARMDELVNRRNAVSMREHDDV
jgi:flagellar FliJ protein